MAGWSGRQQLLGPVRKAWLGGAGIAIAVALLSVVPGGAAAQDGLPPPASRVTGFLGELPQERHATSLKLANFKDATPTAEARELAHWVVHSADNQRLPFIIIDKVQAQVLVFDHAGVLRGATSALVGTAVGDDTVPGIGERKLSTIRPHERTTPAGRFVSYLDRDIHGEEVLWVDYDSALSLHRIAKGQPKERRAERLASHTPTDNRITYGCINVSVEFYDTVVSPLLQKTQGIVYVLPETRDPRVVFGSYPIEERALAQGAHDPAMMPVSLPTRTASDAGTSIDR